MKFSYLMLVATTSLAAFGISTAEASYVSNPVSSAAFGATYSDGGLGGYFAFLNSSGQDPLSFSSGWTTAWTPPQAVFNASFGSAGSYSNVASWDGASQIHDFGSPDTTTYGQTFTAPGSTLSSFNFFVNSTGGNVNFVIAGWNGSGVSGPALFTEALTLSSGSGFIETNTGPLNVSLTEGQQYIAFMTVANVSAVPLPSSAPMFGAALLALGAAGYGLRRKKAAAAA